MPISSRGWKRSERCINNVEYSTGGEPHSFNLPIVQLHIFEYSTLINDEQIGLEIFVKQAAFSDLSFLGQ
jgi:hypothetical protein